MDQAKTHDTLSDYLSSSCKNKWNLIDVIVQELAGSTGLQVAMIWKFSTVHFQYDKDH